MLYNVIPLMFPIWFVPVNFDPLDKSSMISVKEDVMVSSKISVKKKIKKYLKNDKK